MRRALIAVALMTAAAHAGPSEELDAARIAFRQKDCASAKPKLKDLVYPDERLASADSLFEVRAMLGACFTDEGNRENAKAEFERALQLRPRESLDPLFYSDAARRLFDDTRADIENRAKKDEELRKLQQQREALEAYRKSLRVYRESPYGVNFAPFGFGQLQNGQTLKFALFGGAQLVTLGTSAGIWYYLVNKYGIRSDKVPPDDGPSVRRLQQIEIAAGVAFLGVYAWSVIDALRHYEPQRRVQGDDDLLDKALDEQPAPKKTSLYDRMKFGPILTPSGGLGVGLGWEMN
jgi:tetratricopeptide (TPR) repeat protein